AGALRGERHPLRTGGLHLDAGERHRRRGRSLLRARPRRRRRGARPRGAASRPRAARPSVDRVRPRPARTVRGRGRPPGAGGAVVGGDRGGGGPRAGGPVGVRACRVRGGGPRRRRAAVRGRPHGGKDARARRGGRVRALRRLAVVSTPADLRSWIALLEREGELARVSAEVDPHLEITEIVDRTVKSGGPALLFERPKGSEYALLINQFGTERRMCLALGV